MTRLVGNRLLQFVVVGTVAVVALAGSAGAASADVVRVANISDPAGDNGESFARTPTDLKRAIVRWRGDALTVELRYATVPRSYRFSLLLSDRSADVLGSDHCQPNDAESIAIVGTGKRATLRMPLVGGQLAALGVKTGRSARYGFTNPTLTARIGRGVDPFTCVSGNTDGDRFYGGFAGKTLRITSQNATAALGAALGRKFGSSFFAAHEKWVICPREELIPATDTSGAFAACEFEFGRPGGLFHGGWATMYLGGGILEPTETLRAQTYRKTLHRCSIPGTTVRSGHDPYFTNRVLINSESLGKGRACARLIGPAGMAADIESDLGWSILRHPSARVRRMVVGFHGTNLAGFEAHATFPCRVAGQGRSYRFDCRNQLGDRFIYSFVVKQG